MPSLYLQAAEYDLYGLANTTTSDQVIRASTLINSYCNRPEGFLSSDGLTQDATGAAIVETFRHRRGRRVILSRIPVANLISVESAADIVPFSWDTHDVSSLNSLDYENGVLDLPATVPYPGRIRVTYTSGWAYGDLPPAIKLAAATLCKRILKGDDLGPGIKRATAGDATLEWFDSHFFDSEISSLLAAYRRVVPV